MYMYLLKKSAIRNNRINLLVDFPVETDTRPQQVGIVQTKQGASGKTAFNKFASAIDTISSHPHPILLPASGPSTERGASTKT